MSEQFIIKGNSYWDTKYIVYISVITLSTLTVINVAFEENSPEKWRGVSKLAGTRFFPGINSNDGKFKFNVSIYTLLFIVVLGLIIGFYSQSSYITADSHQGVSSSPGINSDETTKLYTINSEHYSELGIPSTVSGPVELKKVYFCGEPKTTISPSTLQTLKVEKLAQTFASNDSENLNRYDELYVKDSDTYERGHIALLLFFILCLVFFIIGAGGTEFYKYMNWYFLSNGAQITDKTKETVRNTFIGLSFLMIIVYLLSGYFIGSFDFSGQDYKEGGIHVNYSSSSSSPIPGESQIEEIIKEFKGDDDLSKVYNSIAKGYISYISTPRGECAEINKDKGGFCKSSNYDDDILGNIPPNNFKPSTDYCIDEGKWNTMVDKSTLDKDLYKKQPILNNLLKDTEDNYLIDNVFTKKVVDFLKKIYKLRDDSDFEGGRWFIGLVVAWLTPGGLVTMMKKCTNISTATLKYCLAILLIIPLWIMIWFINRWWEYREMKQMGADIMNIISGRYNAWNGKLHGEGGGTYDNCSNSQECYVQLDIFRSRGQTAKKITIPESTDKDIFTYECNKLGGCTNGQFSHSKGNILPGECMDNGFTKTDIPPEYAGKGKGSDSDWENCRERDKIFAENLYPGVYKDLPIWGGGGGGRWWGSKQTDGEYSIEKSFNSNNFESIYDKEPWLMYTQLACGFFLLICLSGTIKYDGVGNENFKLGGLVFLALIVISIIVYVGCACYNHYHYKNDSWGIRFEPFNTHRNSGDKMNRQTSDGKKNIFFNYGDGDDDYIGNNSGWQVIVITPLVAVVICFIYAAIGVKMI